MAKINLLPWRHALREEKKKQFFLTIGTFVILSGAVILGVHFQYNDWISTQQHKNNYLSQEIAILDKKITEIESLQREKDRLLARMEVIQELQRDRPAVVQLFNQLVHIVPNGLYLNNVNRRGKVISLEGHSESNTRVSKLMRNIDLSPSLTEPKLSVIEAADGTDNTDPERIFKLKSKEKLLKAKYYEQGE